MLTLKSDFELIEVAGEYMLIPVGDAAARLQGVIALNEAASILLKHINSCKNKGELVAILTKEYDVDIDIAQKDLDNWVNKLVELGVLEEVK